MKYHHDDFLKFTILQLLWNHNLIKILLESYKTLMDYFLLIIPRFMPFQGG